jgi:DNA-binding beta-propeller fold protein YncE
MLIGHLGPRAGLPALAPGAALLALLVLAACGGTQTANVTHHAAGQTNPGASEQAAVATVGPLAPPYTAASSGKSSSGTGPVQALVTDESENRLLVVDLPSGRIVRRIAMAADPENVAVGDGIVVVVSSRSAKVTLLDRRSLRVLRVLGGFRSPHIPAISPDGSFAYITDDARGTLTAISLRTLAVTSTIEVGVGAHHVAFSPKFARAWIALGESASTISIVDTSKPARPRLVGHFDPGFPAHDLAFTPGGGQVWIGSANGPDVVAFSTRGHRLLFRIAVGAGPQHFVFAGRYAFLTSGYGGTIEEVLGASGAVLGRANTPYGSFELDAGHGMVASSSLLGGTLAVYDSRLRLLKVTTIAPAARDLIISPR